MSQWQNTTAMHACAYIHVTAAYSSQKSSKQLFNVPSSVRKPHFENGLEASHTQQHLAVFSTFLNDQNQSAGAPSRI